MRAVLVLITFIVFASAVNYAAAPAPEVVVVEQPPADTCKGKAVTACDRKCRPHCNNGVGNGADCRPGRARYSNDDHTDGTIAKPGAPGSRGGGAAGTTYTTSNKGDNTVENQELTFIGDVDGSFKKTKCHDSCEDEEFAKCDAPAPEPKPAVVVAAPTCAVNKADCEARCWKACGPKTTSSGVTCRRVFKALCESDETFDNADVCVARCDKEKGDKYHSQKEHQDHCRDGDSHGGLRALCQERVCAKPAPAAVEPKPVEKKEEPKPEYKPQPKPAEKPAEKPVEKPAPQPKPAEKAKTPKPAEKAKTPVKPAPQPKPVEQPKPKIVDIPVQIQVEQPKYAPAPCTTRSLEEIQEELLCLSRYVEKLAYAVAAAKDISPVVLAQPLDAAKEAIVDDVNKANAGKAQEIHANQAAAGGASAATRATMTNADGSLTGASIGLIVGCILGAALVAVVIIAFSVVRKRKMAAMSSDAPLLMDHQ